MPMSIRVLCAGLLLATTARPAELKVPQQFPTIQDAVDAAMTGDVVAVGPGTYRENVVVTVDGLGLRTTAAVLDGQFLGPCIAVTADDVELRGFTCIQGGDPEGEDAAVSVDGAGARLLRLEVRSAAGAGLRVMGDAARIERCTVDGCTGTGIDYGADQTVSVTELLGNRVSRCPDGIVATLGKLVLIENDVRATTGTAYRVDPGNATSAGVAVQMLRNRVHRAAVGIAVASSGDGDVRISRNVVEGVAGAGITAEAPGGQIHLFGNRVSDCGGDALSMRSAQRIFAGQNRLSGVGGRGLLACATGTQGGLVERNRIQGTVGEGLRVEGRGVDVRHNRIQQPAGAGIVVSGSQAELVRNLVAHAGRQGLLVLGDDHRLRHNAVIGAGLDGLLISGRRNEVLDNQLRRNGGDGIDLHELSPIGHDDVDNVIVGNTCLDNAHEGIDNSGLDTVIEGNVLARNGGEPGPDIAGAGHDVDGDGLPDGTVAAFTGNQVPPASGGHLPGGSTTPQRLDLGESLP